MGSDARAEPIADAGNEIDPKVHLVPLRDAFRYWAKLGFINFGGPAGQIAIMHEELVDKKRWISNNRFLHALNYCMLLPGPEAQQLAIYIGWLLNGKLGGIAAGVSVRPARVLSHHGTVMDLRGPWGHQLDRGRLLWVAGRGDRAGSRGGHQGGIEGTEEPVFVVIAVCAFVAIYFVKIPFPLIVAGAALIGLLGSRMAPEIFTPSSHGDEDDESVLGDAIGTFSQLTTCYRNLSQEHLLSSMGSRPRIPIAHRQLFF
jgi:chromate transporter